MWRMEGDRSPPPNKNKIRKQSAGFIDPQDDMIDLVIMEGLKFTMPYVEDTSEANTYSWILNDEQAPHKLQWLECPMGGIVALNFKTGKRAREEQAEGVDAKRAKTKKAQAKPKLIARANAATKTGMEAIESELHDNDKTVAGRGREALDCLIAALCVPLQQVQEELVIMDELRRGVRLGLAFFWTGYRDIIGTELDHHNCMKYFACGTQNSSTVVLF